MQTLAQKVAMARVCAAGDGAVSVIECVRVEPLLLRDLALEISWFFE